MKENGATMTTTTIPTTTTPITFSSSFSATTSTSIGSQRQRINGLMATGEIKEPYCAYCHQSVGSREDYAIHRLHHLGLLEPSKRNTVDGQLLQCSIYLWTEKTPCNMCFGSMLDFWTHLSCVHSIRDMTLRPSLAYEQFWRRQYSPTVDETYRFRIWQQQGNSVIDGWERSDVPAAAENAASTQGNQSGRQRKSGGRGVRRLKPY